MLILDTLSSFKAEFLQYRDQQIRPFVISEKDVETEAHKIYNDTRQRVLAAGGMVKPAHILIRLGQKASAAEQDKAKYRADSLYQVLKKGVTLLNWAKKYSDDKGSARKRWRYFMDNQGTDCQGFRRCLLLYEGRRDV